MFLRRNMYWIVGLVLCLIGTKAYSEEPSRYFLNKWIEIPYIEDENLINIRQLNNFFRHYVYTDTYWEEIDNNVWRWHINNNGSTMEIVFVPGRFDDVATMRTFVMDGHGVSQTMRLEVMHAIALKVNELAIPPYKDPE